MASIIKLKDLVPKSAFGTIATVKDEFSTRKLDLFLGYNYPLISNFSIVIVSLNKLESTSEAAYKQYRDMLIERVPNVIILDSEVNRGHMFGTIDLEESILKYIKQNYPDIEYLFKSMDDVVTSDVLLDLEVPQADFYYLPGFSYESIQKAGSKEKLFEIYETFESGFWTPQTTFFIVRINNLTSLYGNDIDDKYSVYKEVKKTYPHVKPWEISFDIKFDCETHLGRSVKDISKHCLISHKFNKLLSFVETMPIWDPAHKNIYFKEEGLCHFHFYENNVYEL